MSDETENSPTDEARIASLERKVYWLKVGAIVLVVALIAMFIPPLAAAIGLLLLVAAIVGGVIVFITAVMYLLDRFFPNAGPK